MPATASTTSGAGDEVRSALEAALGVAGSLPGLRVGVYALGLEGALSGFGAGVGEDLVFPSASLIKILIMAELLRRTDSGDVSLGERVAVGREDVVEDSEMVSGAELPGSFSLEELAEGMITLSDNTATNLLIPRLGMSRVNALAHGLERTALRRRMMDLDARSRGEENTTSARDMVALLAAVRGGPLLCPASRELALGLLLGQKRTSKVPVPPTPGARFAHKTGELPGVEHDAGLVLSPGRSFALAVLTEGNLEPARPRLAATLRLVCEAFSGRAL